MQKGIKEKDIRDFTKYAERLNQVMQRIREYKPEACIYASQESLCLLPCPPHEGLGKSNADQEIASVTISGMDSGAY